MKNLKISDINSFEKDLREQVLAIEAEINKIKEQITELKFNFELRKNDESEKVSSHLRGFEPKNVELELPNIQSLSCDFEYIYEILSKMYNLK